VQPRNSINYVLIDKYSRWHRILNKHCYIMCARKEKVMFEEYPDIVTFDDVCKMLSLSRNTVYMLLRKKKIKSKKVGRIYRIPKKSVIEYMELA